MKVLLTPLAVLLLVFLIGCGDDKENSGGGADGGDQPDNQSEPIDQAITGARDAVVSDFIKLVEEGQNYLKTMNLNETFNIETTFVIEREEDVACAYKTMVSKTLIGKDTENYLLFNQLLSLELISGDKEKCGENLTFEEKAVYRHDLIRELDEDQKVLDKAKELSPNTKLVNVIGDLMGQEEDDDVEISSILSAKYKSLDVLVIKTKEENAKLCTIVISPIGFAEERFSDIDCTSSQVGPTQFQNRVTGPTQLQVPEEEWKTLEIKDFSY